MATLEEMLLEERKQFIVMESFLRQCAKHIRGLSPFPSDEEVDFHLSACKDYFEIYGTRDGRYSPWWTSKENNNGTY